MAVVVIGTSSGVAAESFEVEKIFRVSDKAAAMTLPQTVSLVGAENKNTDAKRISATSYCRAASRKSDDDNLRRFLFSKCGVF